MASATVGSAKTSCHWLTGNWMVMSVAPWSWRSSSIPRNSRYNFPGTRVFAFAHRFTFEFDPVGVVDQPTQDGIGHGGIGKDFVPLVDRELDGNECGSLVLG